MERISKENYYLDIAETVLERATCLRRVYGAIIVKNDEIISTGYNGAPRGRGNGLPRQPAGRVGMTGAGVGTGYLHSFGGEISAKRRAA